MMRGSSTLLIAVLGVSVAASRGIAQETTSLPAAYTVIKGGIGLGGGVSAKVDGVTLEQSKDAMPVDIPSVDKSGGLNVSFGAEAGHFFSLHPNFALGPALG